MLSQSGTIGAVLPLLRPIQRSRVPFYRKMRWRCRALHLCRPPRRTTGEWRQTEGFGSIHAPVTKEARYAECGFTSYGEVKIHRPLAEAVGRRDTLDTV